MRSVTCALALCCFLPWTGACQPSHKKMSTVVEDREVPLPANLPASAEDVRAQLAPQAPGATPGGAPASAPAPAPAPVEALRIAPETAPGPATKAGPQASAAPKVPAAPTPALLADARHFYVNRCAMCHGAQGRGDGVAAQNLRPQPRSFEEAAWQSAARDEDIAMVIVRGGRAIGRSMMMPASTDLADKPEMVRALVAVVRSFGPPAAPAPATLP